MDAVLRVYLGFVLLTISCAGLCLALFGRAPDTLRNASAGGAVIGLYALWTGCLDLGSRRRAGSED